MEIVQELNAMLKKDAKIEWTKEAWEAFENIKKAIVYAPVLSSPDYNKPFYIYSFAFEYTYATVLTQKIEEKEENPISFMRCPFKDVELTYINIKKHVFVLVNAIRQFRHYILRRKVIAILHDALVKTLLMKNEIAESWAK